MQPFAWASKSASADTENTPATPSREIPPYVLPFDGHRPVLICGHAFSGKAAFVGHLLMAGKGTRPVNVIDPTGTTNYAFGGRTIDTLRPDPAESDGAFFAKAAEIVTSATAVEGGVCVIDEFLLMTESYENPLPEQEAFVYVLDEALNAARRNRARILMVSTRVPMKRELQRFGCRFFIGPIMPMDWVMMYGREAAAVETAQRPGSGVLYLDGQFEAIEFPLTIPRALDATSTSRSFRRAKKAAAAADKAAKSAPIALPAPESDAREQTA